MMNLELLISVAVIVILSILFAIYLTGNTETKVVPPEPSLNTYDNKLKELSLMSTPVYFDFENHLKPLVECVHREVREKIKDYKMEFEARTKGSREYFMSIAEANKMSLEVCNTVKECLSVEYLCTLSRYRSIAGIGRLTKQIVDELIIQEAQIINSTVYNKEVKMGMARAKLKKDVKNIDSTVHTNVADLLGITKDDLINAASSPDDIFNAFMSGINKP
ncbi:MAG: hypothetical protein ACRC0G_07535 [Fusobacteriaceae bacterium]